MKLELKILWFDDQPRGIKSYQERISAHLQRQGFDTKIQHIKEIKDLQSLLPGIIADGQPDLILLDWDMGEGTKEGTVNGATIAKRLRRKFKYQEIVFYSAAPPADLRKAVFKQGIDGVFCVYRPSLITELTDILQTMLHKILDMNQMRGIVMSHVSELDTMVSECLYKFHACANDKVQQTILSELHKNITKFHKSKLKKLGPDPDKNSLIEYEEMSVLAARYGVLKKILKDNAPDNGKLDYCLETLDKLQKEIFEPRNALAHATESVEKGKEILKHKDKIYDENEMARVRIRLKAHKDNLQNIDESIYSGQFETSCS